MKTKLLTLTILALLFSLVTVPVLAQTPITLTVHKEFGFNSGSQIEGTFSLDVNTAAQLSSVTYKVDGQVLQEVNAAPYKIQFKTGSYASGWHELSATAITTDGQRLESPVKRFQFLSPDERSGALSKSILPMIAAIFGILAVAVLLQFVLFRSSKHAKVPLGQPRRYGISGGAICPRCGRPFAIHWYALNLMGKLDRCEHCGRLGIYHRVPMDALRAAEAAELSQAQPTAPIHEESPEEQLKRQLDSSRYEDI